MFQQYTDTERLQPIVRFGQISLMPYEPIPISMDPGDKRNKTEVAGYLVEAQSWGGESGAPALVVLAPYRRPGNRQPDSVPVRLLGLVHGHFAISEKVDSRGDIQGSATVDVNSGIGVVIPAADIKAFLMSDELVEERTRMAAELANVDSDESS